MLVMRRHQGDSILIGDDVEIHIISVGHKNVKLGINAPRSLRVVRQEVELVKKENQAAAQSCGDRLEPALARILGKGLGKRTESAEKTD